MGPLICPANFDSSYTEDENPHGVILYRGISLPYWTPLTPIFSSVDRIQDW